jgi:hypothetical protein
MKLPFSKHALSEAVLKDSFVGVPASVPNLFTFQPQQRLRGLLHHLDLTAIFNHPCGFFSEYEAAWYTQSNSGYNPVEPGDNFWQLNAYFGYRFSGRHAELALGILNLTDQDYRLNPLNLYNELPRTRTLSVRFAWNF